MGEWVGGWDGAFWDDFSSWICPFPVGDMDWPVSNWGYVPAPFQLGIWTGPFPIGDMDWPLSGWDMDQPLSLTYCSQFTQSHVFQSYKVHLCVL